MVYAEGDYAEISEGLVSETVAGTVTVPPEVAGSEMVGITVDDQGDVYSWYANGKLAKGTAGNLGTTQGTFQLPIGASPSSVAGITWDEPSSIVWVLYESGAVSRGDADNFMVLSAAHWEAP